MKKIKLTLNKDDIYSYSIDCQKTGGTFSFSTISPTPPKLKDIVDVQHIRGIVERVGPTVSSNQLGTEVSGRLGPRYANEYISITKIYKDDNVGFSTAEIVGGIADSAGVKVEVFVPHIFVKDFSYTGRYVSALENIAQQMCGELRINDDDSWIICPASYSSGTFTVDKEDLLSYNSIDQADSREEIVSLAQSLKDLLIRALEIQREMDFFNLEKMLAELEELEQEEEEPEGPVRPYRGEDNTMGDIGFEFGWKNGAHQQLEADKELVGGKWDTWTPEPDSSQNPNDKSKKYYQIQPVMDSEGYSTDELRGCYNLFGARVRIKVSKPSNASGRYYIKGKTINVPFISSSIWTYWGWKMGERDQEIYFDFDLSLPSVFEEDKQLYRLEGTLDYVPSKPRLSGNIKDNAQFTGIVDQSKWLVSYEDVFINFVSPDGTLYDLQGSQTGRVVDETELVGVIMGYKVILDSDRNFAGYIDGTSVFSVEGKYVGTFTAKADHSSISRTPHGSIQGWVGGTLTGAAWPGLGGAVGPNLEFYHISPYLGADPPDEDNLDSLQFELDMVNQKTSCIKTELSKHGNLTDMVAMSAKNWFDYNVFFANYSFSEVPEIITLREGKATKAITSDEALISAVNSVAEIKQVHSISLIYSGSLPFPGETINGLASVGVTGIIESFSFSASETSCTLNITVHEVA